MKRAGRVRRIGIDTRFLDTISANDRVYIRINKRRKTIKFFKSYEKAREGRGQVYGFNGNERRKMYGRVRQAWNGTSRKEIDNWDAPEWLKEWYFKTLKTFAYATIEGNNIIIKFKDMTYPFIIPKEDRFFYLNNVGLYIYELIRDICVMSGIKYIVVYTNIVELRRAGKIFYDGNEGDLTIVPVLTHKNNLNIGNIREDM